MIIRFLEEKDLDAARKLAYDNYLEECEYTKSLPEIENTPNLSFFIRKCKSLMYNIYYIMMEVKYEI